MEVDLVYFSAVGVVVLNQPLAPNVPDLDGAILAAAGDAGAIGVEAHGVDAAVVVHERIDALARREVPQLDGVIVGAGGNQSLIGCESARTDPIIVRGNREQELAVGNLMDLERLVIRA